VAAAHDGILTIDFKSKRILDADQHLLDLLGLLSLEIIGKTVGECWPGKNASSFQARLNDLQPDGSFCYEDLELETKEKKLSYVDVVCCAFLAGEERLITCGVRDVTERRQREDQLRLLERCVSQLNDILIVTEAHPIDRPGPKIVFANQAVAKITGYQPAELIGKSPRMLQGRKTDRKTLDEIRHALENHQPIRRHLVNYKKDGSEYWLGINLVPIFSAQGNCTHFAAVERDITSLIVQELRIRRLMDSNVQAVLYWDSKKTITEANDNFLQLSGFDRHDVAAGVVAWTNLLTDKYIEPWQRSLADLAEKGAVAPYEIEIRRKDGSTVPVLFGAACIADNLQDGVGFILDLTERKKLEQQVLNAKRLESLGTLAGGMAHHLNNILAPVLMSIALLKMTSTNEDDKGTLDVIDKSATRASAIVSQVLAFARGVKGAKVNLQPRDLLNRIETSFRNKLPKNISLAIYVPNDAWMVPGDPEQLYEVLVNLCTNAVDAMPNGGSLAIKAENAFVDEEFSSLHNNVSIGPYLTLSVIDTGTGISPEIIDRIFDPFFTTKEFNRGNGLGLSMVGAVVKGHGGFVDVVSETGKGSTFKVFLTAGNFLASSDTTLKSAVQN